MDLLEEMKDVFELATGATVFVNEILKLKKNNKKQDEAIISSKCYYAQIGSSGDPAQIDSKGNKAVISGIGYKTIAMGKKGSWLTLAEYVEENGLLIVDFVKSEV